MSVTIHDDRICKLGEGAFWHPELNKLFWCDIAQCKLMCDDGNEWQFDEQISALGWVDGAVLLIASETALFTFDLNTNLQRKLCALEADNPETRSNDGRADTYGGFWIGTMGKKGEPDAGAIYRYYKGELRRLFAPVTIPNAICFSPDGAFAYFTDSYYARVLKVALCPDGWPCAPPSRILDLSKENQSPDGAITTVEGDLLIAKWGVGAVDHYDTYGNLRGSYRVPTANGTCPALGGPRLSTLFVTSALQGLTSEEQAAQPHAGKTFAMDTLLQGTPEPQVIVPMRARPVGV